MPIVTAGTGGGGATTLDGLTDVTITAVADKDILRYDGGLGQWVNFGSTGDWLPQYLLLGGRAGGQTIGLTGHAGGNSTDIALEGRLLLGDNIGGAAYTAGQVLSIRQFAVNSSTIAQISADLSGLSGVASGTITIFNAAPSGIAGYTSGSFNLYGLLFNPTLTVPSGVTVTNLIGSNVTMGLGSTAGGAITNWYGNYVEMRGPASNGPTITNASGYFSSPGWRTAIPTVACYTAGKAALSLYGTGPVTDFIAFDIASTCGATANVTTWSGLRIPNIAGPGTIWGLNITGTMNNRIAGKLLVGATTTGFTDQALEVVGIIEARNSAALRFRGDFNPTGTDLVIFAFDDTGAVELPVSFGLNRYVSIDNVNGANLKIAAGTATVTPIKFIQGVNLTVPVAGAHEWDGTRLYITQTAGPTRKTLAYTDDAMTPSAHASTHEFGGSDPIFNKFAPGSFTLATGRFAIMTNRLELNGSEVVTLQGDSELTILN